MALYINASIGPCIYFFGANQLDDRDESYKHKLGCFLVLFKLAVASWHNV
jgi:hypothetical protein